MSKIDIVLDATMLDTFMSCAAKFNMRFKMNKTTEKKVAALDKGSLVHAGMEGYYKSLKEHQRYTDCVDAGVQDIRILAATDSDLEPSEVSRIVDVCIDNWDYWRVADQRFEILEVERPFVYNLHEDDKVRILMIGKIDLLVNDNTYLNLPFDHKSYERDFPVKRLTNQFINYSNAVGSNYLMVNRIGFQKTVARELKYKRVPLSYDPLIIEQWKQNVIKWAYLYLEYEMIGQWPMNLTSCDKYNRLCEYYEVCDSSGEESKIYKLTANFKTDKPWDVSAALGAK